MTADAKEAAGAVLARAERAWGDIDAFAALFTADADLVHGNGMVDEGREAIVRTMAGAFAGPLQGSKLSLPLQGARYVSDDVLLVRAAMALAGGRPIPQMASLIVLVRDGGEWRIAAWQNTQVREPTPA